MAARPDSHYQEWGLRLPDSFLLSRAPRLAFLICFLFLLAAGRSTAQTKRVVILKLDGLPYETVDRFVQERDSRTGKSQLPWIDHIFYQRGTRLANFYVRGMSLSAPSWSLLDTGQHLQIRANVEFDRYTLHSYDYLNVLPIYLRAVERTRVDTPGTEVLDDVGVPLLLDAYPHEERYPGLSLYQRGMRFATFPNALQHRFKRAPKELLDEWTMGFEMGSLVTDELLKELIEHLKDPSIRYLDLLLMDFDHLAHSNRDSASQLQVLKKLDGVMGQIWTAIQNSPLDDQTTFMVVSDHGINSDQHIYSQGYSLVKLLNSPPGGSHHVVTERLVLRDYSIRGLNMLYPRGTTAAQESRYLRGQSGNYPTALLDFDGNERASLYLRDSDLNVLQIVLQQLQRKDLSPQLRGALTDAFFSTLDRRRAEWQKKLEELNEELGALRRAIDKQRILWQAQAKKLTREDEEKGRDDDARRIYSQLVRGVEQEKLYSVYVPTLANLLALRRDHFEPAKIKIEDVVGVRAMGERNGIYELQNYVADISPTGPVLNANGALDWQQSFQRINYFPLLHEVTVRNNLQPAVSNHPIDLIATRVPTDLVRPFLADSEQIAGDVIWVYGGPNQQALILAREDAGGQLSFRYQPIRNLTQDALGRMHLELRTWGADLPLKILEDLALAIPAGKREVWLSQWHTDTEWLRALHRTRYSNGLLGLYEELARHPTEKLSANQSSLPPDERLLRRFAKRQRELIEADLLIIAKDHWNFDARGFNPGGNHGSFFRISTHSTWMIAGGERTGIAHGLVVEEPYDSLSFVPTLLALTGQLRDDMSPVPVLWEKGFRRFPGRVVREVIPISPNPKIADEGAATPPR
jgi:hypothetical protein